MKYAGRWLTALLLGAMGMQEGATLCGARLLRATAHVARPAARGRAPAARATRIRASDRDDGVREMASADSSIGLLTQVDVCDEMQTSYLSYAMSVILSRALPDVRDGLKPVQRRILYAMDQLSISPTGRYRKCARVVGEVLGKFHPHGDSSVYDALVRMAQPFNLRSPLIDGHGNFGSADPDPPAAMRYTECRLSPLAAVALLSETSPATVPFADNFDSSEREPTVLPAKLPLLLLNGAVGIAVGMATSIPPHNPTELCDAVAALLREPDLPDSDLFRIVKAPDFPTGGEILGLEGVRSLYATGQGIVRLRGKITTEGKQATSRNGGGSGSERVILVVTELPYAVSKSAFIVKVAELVQAGKLLGVAEIRDESDRDGMRVVIELKRDANPALITNQLLQSTPLQSSFAGNMLALTDDGRQPRRLTLRQTLVAFIAFRKQTTRKRAADELAKALARQHIATGLRLALTHIDAIVKALRNARSLGEAQAALTAGGPVSAEAPVGDGRGDSGAEAGGGVVAGADADGSSGAALPPIVPGGLSSEQADAILAMPLRRLTTLETGRLDKELADLGAQIGELQTLMADDTVLTDTLLAETAAMRAQFGSERRTRISDEALELSEADLIQNERCVVLMTSRGYVKRMPLDEFAAQGRGTRGKAAMSNRAGGDGDGSADAVSAFFACYQHDVVLCITERGIAHTRRAYQIPVASRTALGMPVHQLLPIDPTERVQGFVAVPAHELTRQGSGAAGRPSRADAPDADADEDSGAEASGHEDGDALLLVTRCGLIKKTPLAAFANINSRGLVALKLDEGDGLLRVLRCPGGTRARTASGTALTAIVASKKGQAVRFSIEDDALRPTGRTSRGVHAMVMRDGDEIVDADLLDADEAPAVAAADLGTAARDGDGEGDGGDGSGEGSGEGEGDASVSDGESYLLAVTAGGYGKRMPTSAFRVQARRGQGRIALKFKRGVVADGEDRLVALRRCTASDEVLISTGRGTAVRQAVCNIPAQGRTATGVLLQRLDESDFVANIAILPSVESDAELGDVGADENRR